jgi:hypothetical protein
MAEFYCNSMQELGDVYNLLPLELHKDIGITNSEELHHKAIVNEISWRLATILGDVKRSQFQHSCFSPARAIDCSHHHHRSSCPQIYRYDGWGCITANGNTNVLRAKELPCSTSNRRMFGVAIGLPKFVPKPRQRQAIHNAPNLMKQGNRGTGFFLPGAEAYHNRKPLKTGRGSANMKKTYYCDQQCCQERRQQLNLHSHYAGQQTRKRSDTNSTSYGCHDELSLPHEWIY